MDAIIGHHHGRHHGQSVLSLCHLGDGANHLLSPWKRSRDGRQEELAAYRAQEDEVKRLKSIMGLEGGGEGAHVCGGSLPELLKEEKLTDLHAQESQTGFYSLVKGDSSSSMTSPLSRLHPRWTWSSEKVLSPLNSSREWKAFAKMAATLLPCSGLFPG